MWKLVTDVLETQPLPHVTQMEPVLGQNGNARVGVTGMSGQCYFKVSHFSLKVCFLLHCHVKHFLKQLKKKKIKDAGLTGL